jgi:4-hydroxy-4-methyl-2-oxoglutarate aldolase
VKPNVAATREKGSGATDELVARLRALNTAIVCDALDRMHVEPRALHHQIRPVFEGAVVAGRVLPILQAPVARPPDEPYKLLFEALEHIEPETVVVLTANDGNVVGIWGELLSIAARARGAAGAIVDGLTRDVRGITAIRFPVFARGESPLDSEGRCEVFEYGVPIPCGGTVVRPDDIVLADGAGVILIPQHALAEAVERGEEKLRGEHEVREYLKRGDSIKEVFETYGIL